MRKSNKGNKRGYCILGACAIIVAGLGVVASLAELRRVALDEDNCPIGVGAAGHVVVLVDRTEGLSNEQVRSTTARIVALAKELQAGERISVVALDDDRQTLLDPLFSVCSPGGAENVSWLYGNPARVKREFDESFLGAIDQALASLARAELGDHSPILEAIFDISRLRDFGPQVPNRRLVIVSDMLQHMPGYSHFKISASASELPLNVMQTPDLSGVDVTVLYVLRKRFKAYQGDKHKSWWEAFFMSTGSRVEIQPVRTSDMFVISNL